jgi:hypothetical protein
METKSVLAHLLSGFNMKVVAKTPMPMNVIQKAQCNCGRRFLAGFGEEDLLKCLLYYVCVCYVHTACF